MGRNVDDDIIQRMLAERADLERKLAAVEQFLSVYGGTTAKPPSRPANDQPRQPRNAPDRTDKFGTYGKSVIEAALAVLPAADAQPIPTRDLVDRIEARDVAIRGDNKVNALSALLARSSKIKGHGRAGWTSAAASYEPLDLEHLLGGDEPPKENEPHSESAGGSSADQNPGTNGVEITASTQSWPHSTS